MKRNNIIFSLVLLIFFAFVSTNLAQAQTNSDVVSESAPYIEIGDIIVVTKAIDSDAYLMGNEVKVDAPVNGDLVIISANAKVNAPVNGDLKIFSDLSEIKSPVQGSLGFFTNNLYISSTGDIQKDAYGITHKFVHDGRIGRDLNLSFSPQSEVNINGKVVGDMIIRDIRPIYGDGSVIQGGIVKKESTEVDQNESNFAKILSKLVHSFILIAIGAIFYRFFHKGFSKVTHQLIAKPAYNIAFGLSVLLLLPIAIVILTVTVIGIPIAIMLLCTLIIMYFIAPIFVSYLIGNKILGDGKYPYLSLFLGVLVYDTVALVPTLGWLMNLTVFMITMGAIISLFVYRKHEAK